MRKFSLMCISTGLALLLCACNKSNDDKVIPSGHTYDTTGVSVTELIVQKNNTAEITDEINDNIINFMDKTDVDATLPELELAMESVVRIKFSNNDAIAFPCNGSKYAYYWKGSSDSKIIMVSDEFANYINNINDSNLLKDNVSLSCISFAVGYNDDAKLITIDEEINKSLIDFIEDIDTTKNIEVDTTFLGYFTLQFNDGSVLYVDDNDDLLALYCKDSVNTIVEIPKEFKDYLEEFNK